MTVRVAGPAGPVNVGQTAEFFLEVTNTGPMALNEVRVIAIPDAVLEPTQASEGNQRVDDAIMWTIPVLAPGAHEEFQLNCLCQQPSPRACLTVPVSTAQGAEARDQQCLEVRAAAVLTPGNLEVTVADLRDPVAAGREFTYEIRVRNAGQNADRNVALVVTVPAEMTPVRLQTSGPPGTDYTIEGQTARTIRFSPVLQLFPGQTLTYRVRVQAKQAGEVRLRAQVTSQNVPKAMTVEETTQIFAE